MLGLLMCCALGCEDDPPPIPEPSPMAGESTAGTSTSVMRGMLTVDQPTPGSIIAQSRVTVSGVHVTASEVLVNGEAIPVVSQRFSTTLDLADGQHQISVAGGEDEALINILVDTTPPKIDILEPAYGAHVDSAAQSVMTVVGRATDEHSGVETVSVNGQEVLVEANGRFQYTYTPEQGLERPVAIAQDRAGHESSASRGFIYGRFKPWTTPTERGVIGEISAEGFEVLSQAVEGALLDGLLDELIADSLGDNGDVTVTEIIFQDIDVELTPANGVIEATVTFYDLRVFFELRSPSTSGDVYISPAKLSANLYLAPHPDGSLDVQIRDTEVSLDNLNVQVSNSLLDAAISFIEGFVSGLAEDALLAVLEEALVGELLDRDTLSPSFTLLGVEVQVRSIIRELNVTPERLKIIAGAQIEGLPAVNNALGYLYAPPSDPPTPLRNMATLDIQQNMFHLLLSHLWYGGLLNFTLEEVLGEPPAMLSAALLNGFTGGRLIEFMGATEVVGVSLRPNLPPVARFDVTRRDAVIVDFVDLFLDLTLPNGDVWFTANLDLTATIRPRLTNSQLGLQIELTADATTVAEPLFPVSAELLSLLTTLLESLPSQLGPNGISNFFDLNSSSLYGLTFSSAQVETVTSPTPYVQIGLDLNITDP